MSEDKRTRIPVLGDLATDGGSFDDEVTAILWRRTRLIFLTGLVASAVVFLINRWYGLRPVAPALVPWQAPAHLFHPLSFAVALVSVQGGRRTLRRIQQVAFVTVAVNLAVMIPSIEAFYPDRESFLAVGLLLFTTAAFLPYRAAQAWLAGGAVALSAVAMFAIPALVPEVAAYWDGLGARVASFERVWRLIGVALIAGVSVLVSRNLYALQRSAQRAQRLGNYLIEKELGKGGMGQVYVARHAMICRPTAVKVMTSPDGDGRAGLARFEREVQLSASLTHPNTITIFDFGRASDDTFYYAMEYLEGLDLQRIVERFGALPAERVVYLLRQVCGSLGEAHARGIVHRDIKPSNIFVTHRGGLYDFVKVLDFGLARKVKEGADSGLTKTGMVFGTPQYIAPESVYGAQRSDARSDLYNVGGIAYWMLTGRPLFPGATSLDLIIDHVKTVPKAPSEVTDAPIPPELEAVVMRCLEKDPDARYQTAEALLQALQAVPLERRWTQELARAWWERHAPDLVAHSAEAIRIRRQRAAATASAPP